ncbi:CAAX family protease [Liquorilactobacillus ghanensis DSM 18630]|uniref:CAAX family protease n=1 Tax=Liquorilactobacillus ghanensis DSM 18630 TaxID=1423750 RepID=A0A0R1VUI9_9LACO|nr:type II CAAX endopeptidase family protein [Liquorilactobacillus ghanensis]KRM06585.1 CAAX family protease [Liquorilactobacillus ghanensis DSM 18630]
MALRKNSLWLLVSYLIVSVCLTAISHLFKTSSLLYYLLAAVGLIGAIIMYLANQRFAAYQNWLEKKTVSRWKILLLAFGGAIILLLAQQLCFWLEKILLQQTMISQNTTAMLTIIKNYPIYLIYVLVAAPIMEELVFRKAIFGNLITLTNPLIAGIISCLLFSVVHADGHFLTYAIIGGILCWIYAKSGRLQSSMIAHMLMNLVIVIISFK